MRTLPHAVSILDFWGPNAKLCQGGNGGWLGLCWVERLDKTHLSMFHSASNRAHGKHSRNSSYLFHGSVCFQILFYFFK